MQSRVLLLEGAFTLAHTCSYGNVHLDRRILVFQHVPLVRYDFRQCILPTTVGNLTFIDPSNDIATGYKEHYLDLVYACICLRAYFQSKLHV